MTFMNNLSNDQRTQLVNPLVNPHRWLCIDLLSPMRRWLAQFEISNATIAQSICQWIPAQCPFARTISWQGRTVLVIPPLCKLNPLYDELIGLRFRALSYLANQPHQDIYIGRKINAETAKSC